jgi:iron complex outermembrane receptor protein
MSTPATPTTPTARSTPRRRVLSTFNNKEWDGRAEALFGQTGLPVGLGGGRAVPGPQVQRPRRRRRLPAADPHPERRRPSLSSRPRSARCSSRARRGSNTSDRRHPGLRRRDHAQLHAVQRLGRLHLRRQRRLRLGLTAASAPRAPARPNSSPSGSARRPGDLRDRRSVAEDRARQLAGSHGPLQGRLGKAGSRPRPGGAQFDNYIYGALTGRQCDDDGVCAIGGDGELKELNYGQRDAKFWGAEVKGSMPLAKTAAGELSANVLADYVRAKFSNGGGDVPRIQPGRFGGGLGWNNGVIDASFLVLRRRRSRTTSASPIPRPTPTPRWTLRSPGEPLSRFRAGDRTRGWSATISPTRRSATPRR